MPCSAGGRGGRVLRAHGSNTLGTRDAALTEGSQWDQALTADMREQRLSRVSEISNHVHDTGEALEAQADSGPSILDAVIELRDSFLLLFRFPYVRQRLAAGNCASAGGRGARAPSGPKSVRLIARIRNPFRTFEGCRAEQARQASSRVLSQSRVKPSSSTGGDHRRSFCDSVLSLGIEQLPELQVCDSSLFLGRPAPSSPSSGHTPHCLCMTLGIGRSLRVRVTGRGAASRGARAARSARAGAAWLGVAVGVPRAPSARAPN